MLIRTPATYNANAGRPVGAGWITCSVITIAALIFVILGSQIFPPLLHSSGPISYTEPGIIIAMLLDISLLLLAWRRSVELKAANEARSSAEQQVEALAWVDDVTGLPNRRSIIQLLDTFCASGEDVALLLLDLDKFKNVNDLYGHDAGDELLRTVAARIEKASQGCAGCARLGGDEFAIVLRAGDVRDGVVSDLAERLLSELGKPINLENTVVITGASIGISTTGADCQQTHLLLRRSDIAMYEAKVRGRNCYAWFEPEMEQAVNRRVELEAEIRDGLSNDQFLPYFQPTVAAKTGRINGFEVLARWEHPIHGIVEPIEFIPIAETSGLVSAISMNVMRKALIKARDWSQDITISVNVSPIEFKDPLLGQRILKVLTETGFPAGRLELEVTESTLFDDKRLALTTINSLKNQGIRISIDDFGTGYASLSQLRQLPFDRIKIDKSFVAALFEDPQCHAIVHAITTLANNLNIPITAEGVESQSTFDCLRELGCADLQGWYISKAIPFIEAERMLSDQQNNAEPSSERVTSAEAKQVVPKRWRAV